MRNLKRVLALALALVMVIGMMVIGASAASYSDAAAIDEDYAVAVEVLTGMGVFKGQGAGFAPKATLTRAEASALIYRVITADVKDSKIALYDYSSFADVAEGNWATGYITYAANGGYVKGDGTGNFLPGAPVTGVQVLTIMLRAAGYGQKGEFEGAAWKDNVLTTADDLGLLDNVKANDLDKPATRELVAQLIWDSLWAPTTTYTPAFGYWPAAKTLGDKFGLAATDFEYDVFMRPSYGYVYNTGNFATMWNVEPVAEFTTKVTDCALTSAVGAKGNWAADIYTNGALTYNDHTIVATATTATVEGTAQGTLTQVYNLGSAKKPVWHITEIETWLAQVTSVKPATYDAAGHQKTAAETQFTVFYPTGATTTWTLETTEYAKFSYALLTYSEKDGNALIPGVQTIGIVDVTPATPVATAKATYWLNDTTIVGGVTYNNACKFDLGKGTLNAAKTYDVYVDLYGNIIGLVEYIAPNTYAYGVITAMKWVDTNDLLNSGYVLSNIVKMDATTMANTILADNTLTAAAGFSSNGAALGAYDTDKVSETTQYNTTAYGNTLFQYTLNPNGSYNITAKASVVSGAESIKAGVADLFVGTDGNYMATNDNTVYLVKTMVAGQAVYTTYVGYKNVPSMNNVSVQFMKAATTVSGVYSDYVYVDATAATYDGQAGYVWFTKDLEAADAIGYNATGDKAYFAYIDGVKTVVYVDAASEAAVMAAINGWDLYVVTRNADGDITGATRWTNTAIADVTGITGTVITNGTVAGTYNVTGATVYAYAADGSSVTVVPEAQWSSVVVNATNPKTAYVKDLNNDGIIDVIYVVAG